MNIRHINKAVEHILREFKEEDVKIGKKIRFRSANTSMEPIYATVAGIDGPNIRLKIDNPAIANRFGTSVITIPAAKIDILSASNIQSNDGVTEGGMGGLNRCAPAQDVSYENILNDVTDTWKGQKVQVNELSPGKEKDVAAAFNRYRAGVSPDEYYNDPQTQNKVDRRAERAIKISHKHAQAPENINELKKSTLDTTATVSSNKAVQARLDKDSKKEQKYNNLSSKAVSKGGQVKSQKQVEFFNESYENRLQIYVKQLLI